MNLLYRSEMEYKLAEGRNALAAKMNDDILHGPVDIHRAAVVNVLS